MRHGKQVARNLENAGNEEVEQGGHDDDKGDEADDAQVGDAEAMNIKLGSNDHAEHDDEKHAKFEGLRQFANTFDEGKTDGECSDGEYDDQLVEFAG